MATAEELRARIAALNRDTRSRLTPSSASTSMARRMEVLNRQTSRQLGATPATATPGAIQPARFSPNPTVTNPGPPPSASRPLARMGQQLSNAAGTVSSTANSVAGNLGQRVRNATDAVRNSQTARGVANAGRVNPVLNTAFGAALTADALVRGSSEEAQREGFTNLGMDLGGFRYEDQTPENRQGIGQVGSFTSGVGLGVPDAVSRFSLAFQNPTLNPITGEAPGVVDRTLGAAQALVDPEQVRQQRSAAVGRRGAVVTPGALPADQIPARGGLRRFVDGVMDASAPATAPALTEDPSVAAAPAGGGGGGGGGLSRIIPTNRFLPSEGGNVGPAPVNTLRTADGRVMQVNPDAQVNTMSAENFTRIGSGLSQRLGNARMAAAERGDFTALMTPEERAAERALVDQNFARTNESLRGYQRAELTRRLQTLGGNPGSVAQGQRREIQQQLAQLNGDADRAAGLTTAQIDADSRRAPLTDPMMSPSVIAERLRQEGADRRGNTSDAPDLLSAFEPIKDIGGNTTGFRAASTQGVPVLLSPIELPEYAAAYQEFRQSGEIPVTESFVDWVARIQAGAGQG